MELGWIIEVPTVQIDSGFDDGMDKIAPILRQKGIVPIELTYIPFESEAERRAKWDSILPDYFIPFGSINLISTLSDMYPENCGWFGDWEVLKCSHYYLKYGLDIMLNNSFRLVNLNSFEMKENEAYFMRPNANDKSFVGQVVSYYDFHKFREAVNNYNNSLDVEILVCPVSYSEFDEYRLIMHGKDIITGSLYRFDGNHIEMPHIDSEVIEAANNFVERWVPPFPFYALDIAHLKKNNKDRCKILEIGSINMAGLYACDCEKIVDAIMK